MTDEPQAVPEGEAAPETPAEAPAEDSGTEPAAQPEQQVEQSNKPKEPSPLQQMQTMVETMKGENTKFLSTLDEMKNIAAEQLLSGKGFAGVAKTPEQEQKERIAKVLEGTGLSID